MATTVKIIYTLSEPVEIRPVAGISRLYTPDGSYIDTPVYTNGLDTDATVDDVPVGYGKSIYATNVAGWGKLFGLVPDASFTGRFAEYQRAINAAIAAKAAGTTNTGISFSIDGYLEELYWNQIAPHMVSEGFYTKVGDTEYGTDPNA